MDTNNDSSHESIHAGKSRVSSTVGRHVESGSHHSSTNHAYKSGTRSTKHAPRNWDRDCLYQIRDGTWPSSWRGNTISACYQVKVLSFVIMRQYEVVQMEIIPHRYMRPTPIVIMNEPSTLRNALHCTQQELKNLQTIYQGCDIYNFKYKLKMQQLEHQEQQPIVSQQYKNQKKVQQFKQYLVSSGCVMHLIKFLLGVRNKQKADDSVPSDDVLKMFYQYIGAVQVDTTEFDQLKEKVQKQKQEQEKLKQEIQAVKKQIEEKKIAKQKAAEQKRLKQEQQAAKNTKKGGKK